ncbi:MAG: hypothetical protein AB1586_19560 [Pseudomonadota bacterium]
MRAIFRECLFRRFDAVAATLKRLLAIDLGCWPAIAAYMMRIAARAAERAAAIGKNACWRHSGASRSDEPGISAVSLVERSRFRIAATGPRFARIR